MSDKKRTKKRIKLSLSKLTVCIAAVCVLIFTACSDNSAIETSITQPSAADGSFSDSADNSQALSPDAGHDNNSPSASAQHSGSENILSSDGYASSSNDNYYDGSEKDYSDPQTRIDYENTDEEMILIRKLIYAKANETESGKDEGVSDYLDSLRKIDPAKAAVWNDIMNYWDRAFSPDFINLSLPLSLPRDESLCIVVLGFELNDDGSMKNELIQRLKTALNAACEYPLAKVLVSGGGTALNAPDCTEAVQMAAWLTDNGLDMERIIVEDRSMYSADNARKTYELLHDNYKEVKKILLVSSDYHIPVASVIFYSHFQLMAAASGETPIGIASNYACDEEYYEELTIYDKAFWFYCLFLDS